VPLTPDDPEIVERLAALGWTVGKSIPSVTRLAAYGVIRRDDRILLSHVAPGNIGAGLWTLPGGGLAFGESPEAAAIREVEEETGLLARITGHPVIHSDTGEWPFSAGPVTFHTVRFVYPMEIVGGTERREVDGSTDEFAWFALEDVAGLRVGDLVERVLAEDRRPDYSESRPAASSA
jgi:8-oxo-dGTP pyrophosphatase MutT (NUDIX family)